MSLMNALPDKNTIELVARQLGISEAFVEKDWYVTQVLSTLTKIQHPGFELVFSGGTALSKAHKLIERFSEDLDFIIVGNLEPSRKVLSVYKKNLLESLQVAGLKIKDGAIHSKNENRFFKFDIEYETLFDRSQALRSHIQIEMSSRSIQLPSVERQVFSFVAELTKQPPEVAKIRCLDPVETAADKLSALTWRVPDRDRSLPDDDPALVRHIHDLAKLKEIAVRHKKFSDLVLVCLKEDDDRPKNHAPTLGLSPKEKLERMLSLIQADAEYVREYDLFVKGVAYSAVDDTPSFEKALADIRCLIDVI